MQRAPDDEILAYGGQVRFRRQSSSVKLVSILSRCWRRIFEFSADPDKPWVPDMLGLRSYHEIDVRVGTRKQISKFDDVDKRY